MNKTIWKFELNPSELNIEMPIGAKILSIQTQNETPCLWALVDPSAEKETRVFEVFGTGHDVYCDMGIARSFVGTFMVNNDSFVFHVFERGIKI